MGMICECVEYLSLNELAEICNCSVDEIVDIINNQIAQYYPEQYTKIKQILNLVDLQTSRTFIKISSYTYNIGIFLFTKYL